MNKKVSLKEIVGTKIVYAIILTSYYWMWARTDWKDWYETVQYVLGVFLFSFFIVQMIRISKYKKEGIDEMAEQNLKRCDSICLKLFVGVMVVVAFGAAILSDGTLWEGQIALYFRWTCLPDCAVLELDADYRRNNRRLS